MKTVLQLERKSGKFHLITSNGDNKTVETDASESIGGTNKAMRPMELILAALGSCSAIDVISILEKQRQPLDQIAIRIEGERETVQTWSEYRKVHMHFTLTGILSEKKVERALRLSIEEYCSVAKLVEKTAQISYDYEICSPSS